MSSRERRITDKYNKTYRCLLEPSKTGHTFKGYFIEKGEPIVDGTLVRAARNHATHAGWAEITSWKVEIIFTSNTMTREGVEDFVRGYANAKFGIIKLKRPTPNVCTIFFSSLQVPLNTFSIRSSLFTKQRTAAACSSSHNNNKGGRF